MAKTSIAKRENANRAGYLFVLPYGLVFAIFILLPTIIAIGLSFTNYNAVSMPPDFVGFLNYINLITNDEVFMQYVLPNTVAMLCHLCLHGYWHSLQGCQEQFMH